jgi:hypothetical protein
VLRDTPARRAISPMLSEWCPRSARFARCGNPTSCLRTRGPDLDDRDALTMVPRPAGRVKDRRRGLIAYLDLRIVLTGYQGNAYGNLSSSNRFE